MKPKQDKPDDVLRRMLNKPPEPKRAKGPMQKKRSSPKKKG
jgi:hypothetical protein